MNIYYWCDIISMSRCLVPAVSYTRYIHTWYLVKYHMQGVGREGERGSRVSCLVVPCLVSPPLILLGWIGCLLLDVAIIMPSSRCRRDCASSIIITQHAPTINSSVVINSYIQVGIVYGSSTPTTLHEYHIRVLHDSTRSSTRYDA